MYVYMYICARGVPRRFEMNTHVCEPQWQRFASTLKYGERGRDIQKTTVIEKSACFALTGVRIAKLLLAIGW